MMLLPRSSDATFVDAYGEVGLDLEARSLGWALLFGLMLLSIGLDGRPGSGHPTYAPMVDNRESYRTARRGPLTAQTGRTNGHAYDVCSPVAHGASRRLTAQSMYLPGRRQCSGHGAAQPAGGPVGPVAYGHAEPVRVVVGLGDTTTVERILGSLGPAS